LKRKKKQFPFRRIRTLEPKALPNGPEFINQLDADLILWWIALSAWILVPIYLLVSTYRKGQRTLWWQVALGTIAFPVWIFAIGGKPVISLSWYVSHLFVGSIVQMFVTVVFGLKKP